MDKSEQINKNSLFENIAETEPLTDEEFELFETLLNETRQQEPKTKSLFEIDGILTASACGPREHELDELLDLIFSMDGLAKLRADKPSETKKLIDLIDDQYCYILDRFFRNELYYPVFDRSEKDEFVLSKWVKGFDTIVQYDWPFWEPFIDDPDKCGIMLPIWGVKHEFNEDPELGPQEPFTTEQKEKMALTIIALLPGVHQYFEEEKRARYESEGEWLHERNYIQEIESNIQKPFQSHKIGRNEKCPCGSGRKYKHCCGKN